MESAFGAVSQYARAVTNAGALTEYEVGCRWTKRVRVAGARKYGGRIAADSTSIYSAFSAGFLIDVIFAGIDFTYGVFADRLSMRPALSSEALSKCGTLFEAYLWKIAVASCSCSPQ